MQRLQEIASFVADKPAGSIPPAAIERAQLFDRSYAEDLLPQLTSFDRCANVDSIIARLARTERDDKIRVVQS